MEHFAVVADEPLTAPRLVSTSLLQCRIMQLAYPGSYVVSDRTGIVPEHELFEGWSWDMSDYLLAIDNYLKKRQS